MGRAAKVEINKEACTIVGDGSSQDAVEARVRQIKNAIANTEQDYEREKLNERVARLAGGVAILQVGAQTETELKEKKLRVEDALNATKVGSGVATRRQTFLLLSERLHTAHGLWQWQLRPYL